METQWDYFSIKSRTLKKSSNQFVFLGDSLITVLCVENVFNALNLGIAAESVKRAKNKVLNIRNLENKHIVLAYGINDILNKSTTIYQDYQELINNLPKSAIIYVFSIIPVDNKVATKKINISNLNQQINQLNAFLRDNIKTSHKIYYLNTAKYLLNSNGELNSNLHKGDGIHLNELGNRLWIKGIKQEILALQVRTRLSTQ